MGEIIIGTGSFGTVFADGDDRVIKRTKLEDGYGDIEVRCLRGIKHQNVIELLKSMESKDELEMWFPRYDVDLHRWMVKKKVRDRGHICRQIAAGIQAIHKMGYFHRDIKMENIFLMCDTENLVIGDFGWARKYVPGRLNTIPDAFGYNCAPEIVKKVGTYTQSVDVFAFGMLVFVLFNMQHPFDGMVPAAEHLDTLEVFYKDVFPLCPSAVRHRYKWDKMTDAWVGFYKMCIQEMPVDRYSINAAVHMLDTDVDLLK